MAKGKSNIAESVSHHVHTGVYLKVLAILMIFMVLTIAAALVDFGDTIGFPALNIVIAMGIAFTKMMLVILYFMHVKDSGKLTWTFAAIGFFFLIILFLLVMPDYLTRGMLAPQGWQPAR